MHLISSGRFDNAVMQWRIALGKAQERGIKHGIFSRAQLASGAAGSGDLTTRRMSQLGHRKVRSFQISPPIDKDLPYSRGM